jgi:hypothetical protein
MIRNREDRDVIRLGPIDARKREALDDDAPSVDLRRIVTRVLH